MQCLIETCTYNAKHDADMSEHANRAHHAHFRRGRDGAEFVYLVDGRLPKSDANLYPAGMRQMTHYVGDSCPGSHQYDTKVGK